MTDKTTPGPWRLHDMERATIVAGKPGGEVANCLNGFGDQDANAALIAKAPEMAAEIKRLRKIEDQAKVMREIWVSGTLPTSEEFSRYQNGLFELVGPNYDE